jgi:hypothetical protein
MNTPAKRGKTILVQQRHGAKFDESSPARSNGAQGWFAGE